MGIVMPAVKAVIMKDNKILAIKQVINNRTFWDLPGGKVKYGESPYDTLLREVREEVNMNVKIKQPLGMWWFFREKDGNQVVCKTFKCETEQEEVSIEQNPANTENIQEYKWVTKEEFMKLPVSHNSLKELISTIS